MSRNFLLTQIRKNPAEIPEQVFLIAKHIYIFKNIAYCLFGKAIITVPHTKIYNVNFTNGVQRCACDWLHGQAV